MRCTEYGDNSDVGVVVEGVAVCRLGKGVA